ncbi:BCCT family transporter [Halobacillus litoralis]|uniref:BCCT family transporter n=1 Tax=Halobacillus litoralis TaxID=45668 RepID=UPI001CFCECF8|nr:BCCT family transporter [Halobacillus litoralis]
MKKFTPMYWIALSIGIIFVSWGAVFPDHLLSTMMVIRNGILDQFGWFYQFAVTFMLIISFIIAFSKFGKIKLGKDTDKPEYSTMTWFAMLFSAGMGITLLFYGLTEPVTHYANPPVGKAQTIESAKQGLEISYLHYGIHAWVIYAIVALVLAYFNFKKDLPGVMSATLIPLFGERMRGKAGYIVDIIAVFATLFGVAISLGVGAKQINSGLNYLWDIPVSFPIQLIIMGVTAVLFIYSAASGLSKGIKYLSTTNLILTVVLFFAFLILGPTKFVMETYSTTLGTYLQNFVQMGMRFSPFDSENNQWVKDWTIFYWAWWISWTPFVSSFIARVSKGRTVREFLVAVAIAPAIVCTLWFGVFGGAGIYFDFVQGLDVAGQSLESSLFYVFDQLPFSGLLSFIAVILIMTFFVTSGDSATFVLAMQTSNGDLNPPFFVKFSWGVILTAIAVILMWAGGLEGLQAAAIISGFPLTIILLLMIASLLKSFRSEFRTEPKTETKKEQSKAS